MHDDDPMKLTQSLYGELVARRKPIARLNEYIDGMHPLAFTSQNFLEAFGNLFHAFADNWCGIVVGSVEERMQPLGFRAIGETTEANEQAEQIKADDDASRIWAVNEMDLQAQMAHTDALGVGAACVTVWPDADGKAEIVASSAADALVRAHPRFRNRRTAAIRTWMDEHEYEHAEVWTTDRLYLFRSKTKRVSGLVYPQRAHWVPEDDPETLAGVSLDASSSMANPFGVPMVEMRNRPRLSSTPKVGWFVHSELTSIIPLQDATNKMVADMLVASEFAAFPQRNVSGWETDEDEETGEPIEPAFKSGPGQVWWTESDAKFGAFPATDITQYTKAIEMLVQHIASISSTPPHYLNGSADRLSGESLKSAETGLVAKVRRRMETFGPCWEEVIRLAGRVEGIPQLRDAARMETIWKDPETRSEAEHVDAVVKKKALNVPDAQLQEEAGYTPEQIKRFPELRALDDLEGAAAAAAAFPVGV